MTLDLGLVAHATQTESVKLATQCRGNRFANAGLANARRAHQQQDGAINAALKGAYCQKLGDAGLHVIQPVVVRFERGTRLLQIQIVI